VWGSDERSGGHTLSRNTYTPVGVEVAMTSPHIRLQDLPAGQRPRERLEVHGPAALSIPELLSILLRTGLRGASATDLGHYLCARFNTLDALARASLDELQTVRGLGRDKAVTLKAAFELSRRLSTEPREELTLLDSPERIASQIREEALALHHERVWLFLLDTRKRLLRREILSEGLLDQSLVHAREVFRPAILASAHSIVLAHNHPSGDPLPSDSDVRSTRELIRVGRVMHIELCDHVIIGRRTETRQVDWISLRSLGLWS